MKTRVSYHIYAMITIVFWSMAFVLTRMSLAYFSAFSLGFLRYFAASVVLLLMALFTRMKLPKKSDIKWFLLSGLLGFFLYMIVFNLGSQTVTSGTGSVIIATAPVLTAVFERLFYKETLTTLRRIAIAVEFAGVVVLTLLDDVLSLNVGLLWLMAAALILSLYNLMQRRLTGIYTGLQTTAYSIFAGTLMLAVFAPVSVSEVQVAPPEAFLYVFFLGVFPSAIAYVAWAKAFKQAKRASSVSNYMFVTPFLAALFGFLLAGEKLDTPTLVGGGIILMGVLIFNFGDRMFSRLRKS